MAVWESCQINDERKAKWRKKTEEDNSSGSLWAMVSLHSAYLYIFTNVYGSGLNKCLQIPKHTELQMFMQNKEYNRELKWPILKQQ